MDPRTPLGEDVLDDLRAAVRKTVQRAVDKRPPTEPAWEPQAVDEELWSDAAALGWPGLLVDERDGGQGGGLGATMVVVAELGAQLTCLPYLSSAVLAVTAVALGASEPRRTDWLRRLASGDLQGTVAVGNRASGREVSARAARGGWVLDGATGYVLDGASAGLVVVPARLDDGSRALYALEDGGLARVERSEALCVDRSRRLAALSFDQVVVGPDARLDGGDAAEVIRSVVTYGGLALAADAMGAARRALDLSVAYAVTREQFGRPIGSFQAIKHKLADMYLLVQTGALAVEGAARAADEATADAPRLLAVAASYARDAATKVTGEAIQVHGGIGYTWDHPCHRLLKRAKFDEVLLADPAEFRRDLAHLLLDGTASA